MTELGEIPSEWAISKIGELTEIKTGGTPSTKCEKYWKDGDIPWMASGDVNKKIINEVDGRITKSGMENSAAKLLPKDTVMIALNGQGKTKGTVAYLNIELTCNQSLAGFLPSYNVFNSKYLYYNLQSRYFEIRGLAGDGARNGLNLGLLREILIPIPSIKEQEKIASILSTVDEQIDNVDALIEKNKELKKGLMQTLLTKGIGHTKFKKSDIGEIPEAWELFLLENVTERMIVGLATSVTEYYRESGIPIIRNMNIKNGYFDDSSMLYLDEKFANSMLGKTVKTNDVITVHTGSNIGLTCVVPKEYNEAHTFTTLITTTKRNLLNPEYLMYSINSEYGVNEINRLQVGGGKSNLNVKEFKLYRIAVPPIEEQEKIVSILKEVDKKINKYSKKKQLLEQVKTGLIQQLLTGKIRV